MKRIYLSLVAAIICLSAFSQSYYVRNPHRDNNFPVVIHSHNDYRQTVPLFQAYSQKASSIEADIYLHEGKLLVAHDPEELATAPTYDSLYINRIVELFKGNDGRPWKDSELTLQILIDPKRDGAAVCDLLLEKYQQYPEVFNSEVNPYAVRTVISGSRPEKENYKNYPKEYLMMDGEIEEQYTAEQLEHVSMFSASMSDYASWNGKGIFTSGDRAKVQSVIDRSHQYGKPVRFYTTADCPNCWLTLYDMGVDIINTDLPEACAIFFNDFQKKNYIAPMECYPTYMPTYKSDANGKKPKNVIYIIGDGMSFAQVSAAETVNNGLTLTNMRYIGFQQTHALDSYVTDSAAAGSALATGEKHNNRHISASPQGEPHPSLSDFLSEKGYKIGVISAGDITDATPAAYFGHNVERDSSESIALDFLKSKISVLVGSNARPFARRSDKRDLFKELEDGGFNYFSKVDDIATKSSDRVICIDEKLGAYVKSEDDYPLLTNALTNSIEVLKRDCDKGYFVMIEAAKIDYCGHGNNIDGVILETLNMDKVVEAALRIADEDGETLVIVTGDHETGGLTILGGERGKRVVGHFSSNDHTGIMLPVFSYGPGAEQFIGVYDNTELPKKINSILK